MNLRLLTGFTALACVFMASCHPYNEKPGKKPTKGPEKTQPTAEEIKKKKDEEARKKAEDALKKPGEEANVTTERGPADVTVPGQQTTSPPVEQKRTDYAFANKVPGKEGFVFSPYNNKVVDVRDIPSGTLVQDPTYPPAEKKYFRVP
jgi:hypothetical protein